MFKKISILVLGVLFSIITFAQASVTTLCDTYTSVNSSVTSLTTYVSTSTVIPGIHKILSIAVAPFSESGTASGVAVYDATAAAQITNANMKGECESVANSSNDRVFPYPKHLSNGLAIVQSAKSVVTIEYTR